MSTENLTIEERKAYLDQLMREHEGSKLEIGDSVNYYANFENYLRTAKVVDTLKEGSDKEGGYLVPSEYHDKLIQKLEDEHVIRKLATVFTADHNISIPGVSKHGEADWISEGVPYMPLVAMHWQHRFNHMVGRYNDIYRVQMPNITPHVCRILIVAFKRKPG